MGREIIVSLRKDKKVVYEDFVCGRDGATNYIANLINDKVNSFKGNIDELSDDKIDELYSLVFQVKDRNNQLINEIYKELEYYKDQDYKEINKAKNELSALDEARRHCGTYEEFMKFTSEMEQVQEWLDEEDYSRAGSLLDIINKCDKLANSKNSDVNQYELWITLSE